MRVNPDKTSYKILSNSGVIPKESLDRAFKEAELSGKPFLQIVQDMELLDEPKVLEAFSKATGYPLIDLRHIVPEDSIIQRVPVKFASYYKFFPIRHENGKLVIATSRMLDIHILDEMRFALGFEIAICFAPQKDIEEMLQKYYGLAADTAEKIISETPAHERPIAAEKSHEVEDIEKLATTASVAQVVNQIIFDAYKKRASDIHLEPLSSGIRVRYRIDGVLQEAPVPKELKDFFAPMLSRIKIMTNLNVAEKRLPQDGKMRVKTQDETLDLRVSFIPTANGESVVIRILPGKNVYKLEQLGFEAKNRKIFEGLLSRPNGVIFATGPTGSGKSTTLYAALNCLNVSSRKIITIEDPVEYELEGVNQIHVAPEIGLTFANGLRSMLRQDPDVMMVGEVRDLETAEIAIQAALTGHLILSTLHTNDAASGVTRLLDIGVQPYLIASSVIAFIAQRLVRVICPHCKEENRNVPPEMRRLIEKEFGISEKEIRTFAGKGCEKCSGTGYRGRVAIQEFLLVTEPVRKLIMAQATAESIKAEAVKGGMVTLRRDGWGKVLAGTTTVEEILEMTEADASFSAEATAKEEILETLQTTLLTAREDEAQKKESKESAEALADQNPSVPPQVPLPTPPEVSSPSPYLQLRKYKRVPCSLPFVFRVVDYKGTIPSIQKEKDRLAQLEFSGQVADLSAGGFLFSVVDQRMSSEEKMGGNVAFSLGEVLEAGSVLDVKIDLPDKEEPVECMAKILRVMRSRETFGSVQETVFYSGALFLAITSVDRNRLEKFCV